MHTWGLANLGSRLLVYVRSSCHVGKHSTLTYYGKNYGLKFKSIDFVLFPSSQFGRTPVYMELPAGVKPTHISDGDQCQYVLKLNKSLYGLKQANYNWFKKLPKGLITQNFIQSKVDKCVFVWKDCIDCIILGYDMAIVDVLKKAKKILNWLIKVALINILAS